METKPGYQTTEFWVSVVTLLYMFVNTTGILDQIPNRWAGVAMTIIAGLYAVARGQAKQGVSYRP